MGQRDLETLLGQGYVHYLDCANGFTHIKSQQITQKCMHSLLCVTVWVEYHLPQMLGSRNISEPRGFFLHLEVFISTLPILSILNHKI